LEKSREGFAEPPGVKRKKKGRHCRWSGGNQSRRKLTKTVESAYQFKEAVGTQKRGKETYGVSEDPMRKWRSNSTIEREEGKMGWTRKGEQRVKRHLQDSMEPGS